jgi:N-acetylmuramic acid 6-phosphate etherase
VDCCAGTKGKHFRSVNFKAIWIGLAGYDRPKVADVVNSVLVKLFNRPLNEGLRISTDLDLLVTPLANEHRFDTVVILVVGTGSIAMSYRREGDQFIRTGRSGGWGNFLGDDGSGYGLGRKGLRFALEAADALNLQPQGQKYIGEVDPLAQKIFQHFGIDMKAGSPVNLLDRVVTSDHGTQQDASATKKKIASVSRIVLDESRSNGKAKAIVEAGSNSLVRILNLLIESQQIDPASSAVILAGGLMQNETYQRMILDKMSSIGKRFGYIRAIGEPVISAAQSLLES